MLPLGRTLLLATLLVGPRTVQAQRVTPGPASDLLLRLGAPVTVAAGEDASNVAVINNDATVDGRVREGLAVINGAATIRGQVDGSVLCANGRVTLAPTARIGKGLVLLRCQLDRQAGASVSGEIVDQSGFRPDRGAWLYLWTGITIVMVAGVLLFAALGGDLLRRAATVVTDAPGQAVAFGLVAWVSFPIVAGVAFLTIVGAPLGFAILFGLAPATWFLGYLTAAAALGSKLAPRLNLADPPGRSYRAAVVGMVALQLIGLVPVLGGLAMFIAGGLGVGALVSLAWHRWNQATPAAVQPFGSGPHTAPAR